MFEESGVKATVMKYIGKSEYTFNVPQDIVEKEVHWYLMMADNYYSKPQTGRIFLLIRGITNIMRPITC